MKCTIFLILGLVLIARINSDSSESNEDDEHSKIKGHFEILFEEKRPKKSFYLNVESKSLWSCDFDAELMILVQGSSGFGLIINIKELKGWKLSRSWKASSGDIVKSARDYLTKIKSFEDLIEKKEHEIDLIKYQDYVQWIEKNIVYHILDNPDRHPDILLLVNLEKVALKSKAYFNVYFNQKGKGVEVAVPLREILIVNHLIKPLISGIKVQKEKLLKININWKKIFGYNKEFLGANIILVEEITANLKKEVKSVHKGLIFDISKSCSKIVKVTGGKGGKGSGEGSESGSNESNRDSDESD